MQYFKSEIHVSIVKCSLCLCIWKHSINLTSFMWLFLFDRLYRVLSNEINQHVYKYHVSNIHFLKYTFVKKITDRTFKIKQFIVSKLHIIFVMCIKWPQNILNFKNNMVYILSFCSFTDRISLSYDRIVDFIDFLIS